MFKLVVRVVFAALVLISNAAVAADLSPAAAHIKADQLVAQLSERGAGHNTVGYQPIVGDLFAVKAGDRVIVATSAGPVQLVVDRVVHKRGFVSVSGQAIGAAEGFRSTITQSENGSLAGKVVTGDQTFRILPASGAGVVLQRYRSRPDPLFNDQQSRYDSESATTRIEKNASVAQKTAAASSIAILFSYSRKFAAYIPAAADRTTFFEAEVAAVNDAFANSALDVSVSMAGSTLVEFPNDGSDGQGVDDIRRLKPDSIVYDKRFIPVEQMRAEKGADLVAFARIWKEGDSTCGVATSPHSNFNSANGYIVFGAVTGCDNNILAHEVGHVLGVGHQASASSGDASESYAHAYVFASGANPGGTIVATGEWTQNRYSDPNATDCNGGKCGDSTADATRMIRESAPTVAAYAPGALGFTGAAGPYYRGDDITIDLQRTGAVGYFGRADLMKNGSVVATLDTAVDISGTQASVLLGPDVPTGTGYSLRLKPTAIANATAAESATFTIDAFPPYVGTVTVSNVGMTNATMTVDASGDGSTTDGAYVLYDNSGATELATLPAFDLVTTVDPAVYEQTAFDLTCNTGYQVAFRAVNDAGTTESPKVAFTTGACGGNVASGVTATMSGITARSADMNIAFTNPGETGSLEVHYGLSNALGTTSGNVNFASGDSNGTVPLDGLNCGESYFARGVVRTADGAAASDTVEFSTAACAFGEISFAKTAYEGSEGNTVTITVSRAGGDVGPASVEFYTFPDTATVEDFEYKRGTLSWADGETGAKTFVVGLQEDDTVEDAEAFAVSLINAVGAATGTTDTTVTIAAQQSSGGGDSGSGSGGGSGDSGSGGGGSIGWLPLIAGIIGIGFRRRQFWFGEGR